MLEITGFFLGAMLVTPLRDSLSAQRLDEKMATKWNTISETRIQGLTATLLDPGADDDGKPSELICKLVKASRNKRNQTVMTELYIRLDEKTITGITDAVLEFSGPAADAIQARKSWRAAPAQTAAPSPGAGFSTDDRVAKLMLTGKTEAEALAILGLSAAPALQPVHKTSTAALVDELAAGDSVLEAYFGGLSRAELMKAASAARG